ncbi:MAG: DMT family protein [Hyphomicrobiales bacterium]|nr:DMT family protein [Hyphomicrobiales bacterium]
MQSAGLSAYLWPIALLVASNVFMTFAWYGHLKFKSAALATVVLVSWGIAFFEYWLAVPANRIGHQVYSAAELKTIQEVITLSVFAAFSVLYLNEPLTWRHAAGFALIACGAALVFSGRA